MPKRLFALVLIVALAAAGGVGIIAAWSPIVEGITVLSSLIVVLVVAGHSQSDLIRFKKERSRWPRRGELDAWNREMYGRRAKAKRVAAATIGAKAAERVYRDRLSKSERSVQTARRAHANAVADASKALTVAHKRYDDIVSQAVSGLNAWRNPGRGSRIASFKGLELYQHALVIRNQTIPILQAQAAMAGHFLTIQIAGTQEVIKLSKGEVATALQFTSQLGAAAASEITFEQQRPAAIPAAEQYLRQVKADTTGIESARAAVAAAESDAGLLAAIQEAERNLAAAHADNGAVGAANSDLRAQRESAVDGTVPVGPPIWLPRTSNAVVSIMGIVLIAIVAGGFSALSANTQARSTASVREPAAPTPSDVSTIAEPPTSIATPAPVAAAATPVQAAAAPTVAETPTPATDPHSLTTTNVQKSINDNQSFLVGTNFDGLQVTIDGAVVTVQAKPAASWDEKHFFRMGASDGLVSAKAILGWYPTAQKIRVVLLTDFTDQYGKSSTQPGVWLDVGASTAQRFDYGGLKDRVTVQPSLMYCDGDSYFIHPGIWKNLDVDTRGCLSSFSR